LHNLGWTALLLAGAIGLAQLAAIVAVVTSFTSREPRTPTVLGAICLAAAVLLGIVSVIAYWNERRSGGNPVDALIFVFALAVLPIIGAAFGLRRAF